MKTYHKLNIAGFSLTILEWTAYLNNYTLAGFVCAASALALIYAGMLAYHNEQIKLEASRAKITRK